MSYFFSPIGNSQIVDTNGDPLVGGTISTYLAGTSTPATTYTDNTGATAQGPVMTLNSLGYPENGPVWLLGGVALKFIIKDAMGGVMGQPFDNISGGNDSASVPTDWVLYSAKPTYISPTSFSVDGDQTNYFQRDRRLQSSNTGGTVYSTVSTAVFSGGITTVTVINTSGFLDSGLSSVSYGLIAPVNTSAPSPISLSTAQATTSGTSKDFTGIPATAKRITIMFASVSLSGAAALLVQLGAGTPETSGYLSSCGTLNNASGTAMNVVTSGFQVNYGSVAAGATSGKITLDHMGGNKWVCSGVTGTDTVLNMFMCSGVKTFGGVVDRVHLTTTNGTDTFDAGSVNISWE